MILRKLTPRFLLSALIILFTVNSFAQNQDCFQARAICGDAVFPYVSGPGFVQEFSPPLKTPGCFDLETNSTWIFFAFTEDSPSGAMVSFTITPELTGPGSMEDYDWALFGPNIPCPELQVPWSCNAAPPSLGGKGDLTGIQPPAGGMQSTPKVKGNSPFNAAFFSGPGQKWYLLVNNFSGNKGGFKIEFQTLAEFDCETKHVCEVKMDIQPDITICQGPANPIQLKANYSGNIYDPMVKFFWTADPPEARDFLSDTFNLWTNANIPADFVGVIKYTYNIKDADCDVKKTTKITVLPAPVPTLEPITDELCTTGEPIPLVYAPPGGVWVGDGPIYNGILDPELWPTGYVSLKYIMNPNSICKRETEIDFTIVEGPTAVIDFVDEFCITDPVTTLTAFDLTGKWGGAANAKGEIDPKKLGPGSHKVTYTVTDKQCVNTDEIFVEVKPLPDIFIKDPGALCSDQSVIQIKHDPLGGIWTGVPDSIGKIYPSSLGAGSFTGYYEYTDIFGCKNKDSVEIKVNDPPAATVTSSYKVCNIELNSDTTKVNFTSLITAGDNKGTWVDVDSSGATGTFPELNFLGVPGGIYNFTYTTNTAIAPCKDVTYNVQIIVAPCECPKLDLKPDSSLCSDNGQLDLESLNLNAYSGIWSISSSPSGTNPAQIIGSNIFTVDNSNPGTYVINFSLSDTLIGCPYENSTVVYVETKPQASVKANTYVCNQFDPDKGPVTLDFTTLITSGDNSGSWVEITNSGASGTLPNLDFTGVQPDIYTFKYTTGSAKLPCTNTEYTATVIVQNCACPSVELVSQKDICMNSDSFDLNTLKITTESGIWTIKTSPGSNPATVNGDKLYIKDKDPGTYVLVFALSALPPDGCLAISEVVVDLYKTDSTFINLVYPQGTVYQGVTLTNDTIITSTLVNQAGCDSTVVADIKVTTGTSNQLNNGYFRILPNPAKSVINIIASVPMDFENYKVFNTLGQELISFDKRGNLPLQIDINVLPDGFYVLKIKLKEGYISDTFIKSN